MKIERAVGYSGWREVYACDLNGMAFGKKLGEAMVQKIVLETQNKAPIPTDIKFTVSLKESSANEYSFNWKGPRTIEIYSPKSLNPKMLFESVVDVASATFGEGFEKYAQEKKDQRAFRGEIRSPSEKTSTLTLNALNEKADVEGELLDDIFCVACGILLGLWYYKRQV